MSTESLQVGNEVAGQSCESFAYGAWRCAGPYSKLSEGRRLHISTKPEILRPFDFLALGSSSSFRQRNHMAHTLFLRSTPRPLGTEQSIVLNDCQPCATPLTDPSCWCNRKLASWQRHGPTAKHVASFTIFVCAYAHNTRSLRYIKAKERWCLALVMIATKNPRRSQLDPGPVLDQGPVGCNTQAATVSPNVRHRLSARAYLCSTIAHTSPKRAREPACAAAGMRRNYSVPPLPQQQCKSCVHPSTSKQSNRFKGLATGSQTSQNCCLKYSQRFWRCR